MQSAGTAEELRPGDGSSPSEQVMLSSGATAVLRQTCPRLCSMSAWLDAQAPETGGCVSVTLFDGMHGVTCSTQSAALISTLFSLL